MAGVKLQLLTRIKITSYEHRGASNKRQLELDQTIMD